MPLQTGRTILNKYRIERTIGEGGFGYVYEAVDLRTKGRVAIKELKPQAANDRTTLNRFVNEARAVQALNDPHIVRFFEYINIGTGHYIVLEFMDGGSLADLLKARGTLSAPEGGKIAVAVCNGLASVHGRGIVHRDIKPSNVLVMGGGRIIKIGDFGVAHVPSALSGVTQMTRTGMTMGTPWYMSPEQARGERVDARSDLYSVGAMLYEMCAGYTYLDFSSDMFRDVELVKTRPPRTLPAQLPQNLRGIILKSLAKDPSVRYQSAAEMSAALAPSTSPGTIVVIPRRPKVSLPTIPSRPHRSSIQLLLGGGIGLAFLFIIALVLALRNQGPTPSASPISGGTFGSSAMPSSTLLSNSDSQGTRVALASANSASGTTIALQFFATQAALAPPATRPAAPTNVPTLRPPPTILPIPTAIPRPVGNCADPGAQIGFQDGYHPDTYFHILGMAKAPNFLYYLVEYADRTDNPQWKQLREPVYKQVVDVGELAEWDLPTLGGHQWYVRVTVYLNDNTTLASCYHWIQR